MRPVGAVGNDFESVPHLGGEGQSCDEPKGPLSTKGKKILSLSLLVSFCPLLLLQSACRPSLTPEIMKVEVVRKRGPSREASSVVGLQVSGVSGELFG